MTDLHCHILRDMDDGPAALAESLELCQTAVSNRIERIVATPHFTDAGGIDDFVAKRTARLDELTSALKTYDIKPELFAGAEVYLTDALLDSGCLNHLTINGSRYILSELPNVRLNLRLIRAYMLKISSLGLVPILAHPERYVFFQRDNQMLDALLDKGVLLQINADSLCRYGKGAEYRLAIKILRSRAAAFIATDAHSAARRPNNLLEMLSALPADIDYDYLDTLVNINPNKVLQDSVVTAGRSQHHLINRNN